VHATCKTRDWVETADCPSLKSINKKLTLERVGQYWLPGLLILLATAMYSRARGPAAAYRH
jgi:hypothetical protein